MNDDTEVREVEDARADAVRTMMSQWRDGKLTDAQDTFDNMMNQRADELVASRKQEVAANMFDQINLPEPTAGEVDFETPEVSETETETEDEAV